MGTWTFGGCLERSRRPATRAGTSSSRTSCSGQRRAPVWDPWRACARVWNFFRRRSKRRSKGPLWSPRRGEKVKRGVGIKAWFALVAAMALAIAGCASEEGGGQQGGGGAERGDIRIAVVTHGQASDPFWSVVKNGVDQGAEDMGVEVEYNAPQTFDMVKMSQLIDAAVASKPDGLVVSIPDADALGDSIRAAIAAGIPVISMNSGSDVAADFGLLTHVGQTEYEAGLGAGQRMGEAGVTTALCVNQEVGNVALDDRCRGFTDGLAESG